MTINVQRCTFSDMRVSVSEARGKLPELLDRVSEGEEITLTRHGVPVAVLVRPQALRARRAAAAFKQAEELHQMLLEARKRPLREEGLLSAEWAEERVVEMRRDRDAR
jgi:antitoxin (DNA-binding transcriptional repressor) of toxin-antitoxin stability system